MALIAPAVFNATHEYPIAAALAAALLPRGTMKNTRARWIAVCVFPALLIACALATALESVETLEIDTLIYIASGPFSVTTNLATFYTLAAIACAVALRAKPLALAAVLGATAIAPSFAPNAEFNVIARERTFFGTYRIVEYPYARLLYHGTTVHGAQMASAADARTQSLTTYYAPQTPFAEAIRALTKHADAPLTIALAGLGTGSLACYATERDRVHIYEIDPAVVHLAKRYFAALRTCAPDARIVIGDARLRLSEEPDASIDVLALDTFSSDAIPVHMLTREAFAAYLRVLAPGGVILVHITNRHLDLKPVVAQAASAHALAARTATNHDTVSQQAREAYTYVSSVVALARDDATLDALSLPEHWKALARPEGSRGAWTDTRASIVPLLTWHPNRAPQSTPATADTGDSSSP